MRHQLLIPLLLALLMQLDRGEVTEKEVELLGRDLGPLEAQLDLAADTNDKTNLSTKPHWMTDKVGQIVHMYAMYV